MTIKLSDFTLIVHIGPGKTGSSSLQSTATEYFEQLKNQHCYYLGVMFENAPIQLYPWQNAQAGPEHLTNKDIIAEKQLFKILQASITDLTEKNFTSALWSNESTLRSGTMTIKVLNQIARMGVKVIVYAYIRNHEELIQSSYIQWGIKLKKYQGPVKPFKEWVTQQNILWYPKIEKWLNQGFQFILKNYDAVEDVAFDFFQSNQLKLPNYVKNNANVKPNNTLLAM